MTVLLGLGAALAWGLTDLQLVRLARLGTPPLLAMAWALLIGLGAIVPLAVVVDGLPAAGDGRAVAAAAVAGVGYLSGFALVLHAVSRGSLAVVAPLVGLEGGIAAVIAIALGEDVDAVIAIALVAAVAGGVLTAIERGRRTAAGVGAALTAAVTFGGALVLFAEAEPVGPLMAVAIARLTGLVVAAPVILVKLRPLGLPVAARRYATLAGLLDVCGFVLFAGAASLGPVSVASVASAQFSLVGVAIAMLVLHERPAPWQLAGIATTLVAVSVLAGVL
jgi:drug/metabolite transporter (DMT)-like permease